MHCEVVLETDLSIPLFKRGKVRDVYDLKDRLLIVSTDRISAFDIVLPNGVPCKGEALNRLSAYWFNETKDIVHNHILEVVDPRTVLVRKTNVIKIEFVLRGYLYGSLWKNYVNGKAPDLPSGLGKAERLPNPVLTPTTKAEVGHDVDLEKEEVVKMIGKAMVNEIEEVCIKIYEKASSKASASGIIIADTKLEFGLLGDELILIDELLTPDSSRFWPVEKYEIGKNQFSFDKQYVRDYLESIRWNKQFPAPTLPEHIVLETSKKYVQAYEGLTGRTF